MKRKWWLAEILIGVFLTILVFSIGYGASSARPQETVAKQLSIDRNSQDNGWAVSAEVANDKVATYTLWLTGFTGALCLATIFLAVVAAIQVLYFSRKERAFVFQKRVDVQFIRATDGYIREWTFTVLWENSGGTPTREMRYRVTHELTDNPLPRGHAFTDRTDEEDCFAVLGPGGEILCLPIEMHIVDIDMVRTRKKHLYLWGWVEYRTVFWFSRTHRTEFCVEIVVEAVAGGQDRVGMPIHREHNTAT